MRHNIYSKVTVLALGVSLLAGAQQVMAQNQRNLSLDEAITLGLQNSKQLKVSNAKVEEAIAILHQAKNAALPDLKLQGAYMRLNNPNIDLKIKLNNSSDNGGSTGNGGTGESGQTTTSSISVDQAAYVMPTADVPIFSGLRIHYGIESARYLEQAAKLDAGSDREAVISNTIAAYSNLYKAQQSVTLVEQNLKQSKQRVQDFSNMETNGVIARNDLLKSQLEESNVELSLLDAQSNLKVATVNMDLMLGLPEETELSVDTTAFVNQSDAGTLTQWETTALNSRKDLAALSMRIKAANANIRATKGEYYPALALTGNYAAINIPNLFNVYNIFSGGLGLSYNVGSLWKNEAKVAQARAQMHEIEGNQDMMLDNVHIQINKAYQNYLVSLKKIDVYAKAIEQADENYKINKNKYDNSLVTTTDLLDADVSQLQAHLNYEYAKADAIVAYKQLQQAAGVLDFNTTATTGK